MGYQWLWSLRMVRCAHVNVLFTNSSQLSTDTDICANIRAWHNLLHSQKYVEVLNYRGTLLHKIA